MGRPGSVLRCGEHVPETEGIRKDGFPSGDGPRRRLRDGETQKPARKTSVFSEESVPYIVHPFIMACHAHALGIRDDAVLATVLLHDICEDCGIAPDELPFSPEVREAVRLLTRTEPEDLDAYFSAIAANSTASIVKALDRCNNVSTMMLGFSTEGIIEYVDETQKYVIPLLDHIKKEYTQYYDAVFVLKYQILSVLESAKATILRM